MEHHQGDIDFIVSAPGKVILFGEHSVVYKKAAVSTSIDKRLSVIVSPAQENKIQVKFPQVEIELDFTVEQLQQISSVKCPVQNSSTTLTLANPDIISFNEYVESLKNNCRSLLRGIRDLRVKPRNSFLGFLFVLRGIVSIVGCNLIPFKLEVNSDIEVGAGTGSSAAFAVAISGAVYHYVRCIMRRNNTEMPEALVSDSVEIKSYPSQSGFSMNDARIINKWAFCIEKLMHGHPSGIDNTTCTFGSIVITSANSNSPEELSFRFLENIPKITILLIATGESRNTSDLVAKVKQLRARHPAAIDGIFNAMDLIALEAFKTLDTLGTPITYSKSMEMYCSLAELIELNHGLLRTLGVSHRLLESIIKEAAMFGLSSKLTGAGGGGNAITLVPPNFSTVKLKANLEPMFKVTEVNIGEDGVRLEKLC